MDNKVKDSVKTKDVLKQLQSELRQLQGTVHALQQTAAPGSGAGASPVHNDLADKGDWTVQYAVHHRMPGGEALKTGPLPFSENHLSRVTDEAVAALGDAVSSPQKVALLRALLVRGAESAAALGMATQLSTGSLYHHLHDLMHTGLIGQTARNRYVLTGYGRRVLLVLLALAAQP